MFEKRSLRVGQLSWNSYGFYYNDLFVTGYFCISQLSFMVITQKQPHVFPGNYCIGVWFSHYDLCGFGLLIPCISQAITWLLWRCNVVPLLFFHTKKWPLKIRFTFICAVEHRETFSLHHVKTVLWCHIHHSAQCSHKCRLKVLSLSSCILDTEGFQV